MQNKIMDKSIIIKSLTNSFANVLKKNRMSIANQNEAKKILESSINLIEQNETKYRSAINIAKHACDQLKKLNEKI